LSLLAAVHWIVVALKLRLRRRPGSPIVGGLLLAGALVALVALNTMPRYSPGVLARVDGTRQELAVALERYRLTHGEYPATLEDAGIQTPRTPYGPLRYHGSRSVRPHWYYVSFGNPTENGFRAAWDSRSGRWTVFEYER
jgi:hypothetical protein